MTYYMMIEDGNIIGAGQCPCIGENIKNIEVTEELYNSWKEDKDRYIYSDGEIVENPDYEQEKARKERERLDALTLTPSDVERALLAAKGMDFDDMKKYLKEEKGYSDAQIKVIGVELRASDFFRGATIKGTNIRIVDTIGALLGYSSEDMDYLFIHKELPNDESPDIVQ